MKYFKFLTKLIALSVLFLLIFLPKAYAYLDPGTGSYVLQLIIGVLLGGLFVIKAFWRNIKTFFTNIFLKRRKNEKDNA